MHYWQIARPLFPYSVSVDVAVEHLGSQHHEGPLKVGASSYREAAAEGSQPGPTDVRNKEDRLFLVRLSNSTWPLQEGELGVSWQGDRRRYPREHVEAAERIAEEEGILGVKVANFASCRFTSRMRRAYAILADR